MENLKNHHTLPNGNKEIGEFFSFVIINLIFFFLFFETTSKRKKISSDKKNIIILMILESNAENLILNKPCKINVIIKEDV